MIVSLSKPRPQFLTRFREIVVASVCLVVSQQRAQGQQDIRIAMNPGQDRITIAASNVPRADLLELLSTKYRIEVRPYLDPAEHISVNVVNLPIDSAIAAIMPKGAHYIVRLGDRDVSRVAISNEPKRGPPERRDAGLSSKKKSALRKPIGPAFKPDPGKVRERPGVQGPGLKPVTSSVQVVPPGRGPKAQRSTIGAADSSLRISFFVRAPDSIRPVSATLIEGGGIDSSIVRGPFLFALRNTGGSLVYFGSLIDPLEEHSYIEATGHHNQARAREGIFAISLPLRVYPQLGALRLDFYDARNVSLPLTLDAATFERAAAQAKNVARVEGRALLTNLREGPRK